MKVLFATIAMVISMSASAGYNANNPGCNSGENFAGPECWGTPAYQQKGKGDTRNEDYTYCNTDSENWARGYFECQKQNGHWVHARAPKYVPNCDGSEKFGSTTWWACRNSGN